MRINFDNMNNQQNSSENLGEQNLNPNSDEVVNEGVVLEEVELNPEQEESAEILEEINQTEQKDVAREKIEEADWESKTDEEKEEIIYGKKEEIEDGFRNDPEIAGILGDGEMLKKYSEEIAKGLENVFNARMEATKNIKNGIGSLESADLSQFSPDDQKTARDTYGFAREVTQRGLNLERLKYLLEGKEELFKSHISRVSKIEDMEEILKEIDEFEKFMFQEGDDDREMLEAEARGFAERLEDMYRNSPDLLKKLIPFGVGATFLYFAAKGIEVNVSADVIAFLASAGIVAGAGALGVGAYLGWKRLEPETREKVKKKIWGATGFLAKAVGTSVIGWVMIADSISSSKKLEGFMKWLTGENIPSWAQDETEKK